MTQKPTNLQTYITQQKNTSIKFPLSHVIHHRDTEELIKEIVLNMNKITTNTMIWDIEIENHSKISIISHTPRYLINKNYCLSYFNLKKYEYIIIR